MLWNKKQVDFYIYKEKKQEQFLIVFPDQEIAFCGIYENSRPIESDFCHSTYSMDFLEQNCMVISQNQLEKYPAWYEFFNNYIERGQNERD